MRIITICMILIIVEGFLIYDMSELHLWNNLFYFYKIGRCSQRPIL